MDQNRQIEDMPEVLYEDNHLIVVNKRPGDIVQGDKTGDTPLSDIVKAYIKKKYNKPGDVFLGTIHRIDRPVSGVVVFARTSKALSRMNEAFRENKVQKTYWAVVDNAPSEPSGQLVHYLKKNQKQNKSKAFDKHVKESKKAELSYQLLMDLDRYFLLKVVPKTGRHHQIRVQLAAMGCTIKGDLKYGAPRSNKDASIHLHALKLEFLHPVKKEQMVIKASPPKDAIWDSCAHLMDES